MLVKHTRNGWLINGLFWESEFARAIAPVEYQLLMAKRLRRIALNKPKEEERLKIINKAILLEESAKMDAACEFKWGARKRNV